MTGTDPAVEAAQRLAARWEDLPFDFDDLTAAAREALAPIRELHTRRSGEYTSLDGGRRVVQSWCSHDHQPWPCPTARLIYTSEELTND